MLLSLELELAHSSRVLGAVRIALERAEVRRPIPRTSINIQRAEEGRADSKHVDGLSERTRLECTRIMLMVPCAKVPVLSREIKVHGCQKSKSMHP